MLAAGITIGLLMVIILIYNAGVERLKKRSTHMNVIVSTFSPGQVFLNSLWPALSIIFLLKSLTPIELTPSEHLASMFILGPLTLWTGYLAWSLGENSGMKPMNGFIWMITVQSCFWLLMYWSGGTAFHSGIMNEWDNDYIWAYATIDYDEVNKTYNPNAWEGPMLYLIALWCVNVVSIFISIVFYKGSLNQFCSSVLQGIGIYQVLIITAMITDNSSMLIYLNSMIESDKKRITY
jgi:hypothetical protein